MRAILSIMVELFGGHQQASNEFRITRYNNNNKPSLRSFKKLSKLRQARQLAIASFNFKKQPVVSGRKVKKRPESRRLQRKPKESIVEAWSNEAARRYSRSIRRETAAELGVYGLHGEL